MNYFICTKIFQIKKLSKREKNPLKTGMILPTGSKNMGSKALTTISIDSRKKVFLP